MEFPPIVYILFLLELSHRYYLKREFFLYSSGKQSWFYFDLHLTKMNATASTAYYLLHESFKDTSMIYRPWFFNPCFGKASSSKKQWGVWICCEFWTVWPCWAIALCLLWPILLLLFFIPKFMQAIWMHMIWRIDAWHMQWVVVIFALGSLCPLRSVTANQLRNFILNLNRSLFQDDAYIHDHPFGFNQIENLWEISPTIQPQKSNWGKRIWFNLLLYFQSI